MTIGIPKEIKQAENRVSCTPGGARMLVNAGHKVFVEKKAGNGCGFKDKEYLSAGANIVKETEGAWATDMVIKVKEPQKSEYKYLTDDQILFTFLHLAAEEDLTKELAIKKTNSIAYETIEVNKKLPLLEPMSEIAGSMSSIVGAFYLSKASKGNGNLICGTPGVTPANVMVIGGGASGYNAAKISAGMGANVKIFDINMERLRFLDSVLPDNCSTIYSNEQNIIDNAKNADIIIGAVLIPGAKAPKLITKEILAEMPNGSVFVDIAIDQGGSAETSKPTSHKKPIFIEQNVVHYCVTNMPGAYARTSTFALTNVTLPYALKIANNGIKDSCKISPEIKKGINTYQGNITCQAVASAHNLNYENLNF